jgi:hypothetical protein
MNNFKKRIGTAALLLGTLVATTNLPSLAWGGCFGYPAPVYTVTLAETSELIISTTSTLEDLHQDIENFAAN